MPHNTTAYRVGVYVVVGKLKQLLDVILFVAQDIVVVIACLFASERDVRVVVALPPFRFIVRR